MPLAAPLLLLLLHLACLGRASDPPQPEPIQPAELSCLQDCASPAATDAAAARILAYWAARSRPFLARLAGRPGRPPYGGPDSATEAQFERMRLVMSRDHCIFKFRFDGRTFLPILPPKRCVHEDFHDRWDGLGWGGYCWLVERCMVAWKGGWGGGNSRERCWEPTAGRGSTVPPGPTGAMP